MSRACIVEGCDKPHISRGFCQNHYRVFMRHGTPTPAKAAPKTFEAVGGYLFRMIGGKTTYLHVQIAEAALGHPLPPNAEVHHMNGDPKDNRPANLVICPNHEYHMLLHQRARSLAACGRADWRPCRICGTHDDTGNMHPYRRQFYHTACLAAESRARRALQKEQQWKQQKQSA